MIFGCTIGSMKWIVVRACGSRMTPLGVFDEPDNRWSDDNSADPERESVVGNADITGEAAGSDRLAQFLVAAFRGRV